MPTCASHLSDFIAVKKTRQSAPRFLDYFKVIAIHSKVFLMSFAIKNAARFRPFAPILRHRCAAATVYPPSNASEIFEGPLGTVKQIFY